MPAVASLARSIAQTDAEEFANQYPAYLSDIAGETHHACTALRSEPVIRERYAQFVSDMVYGVNLDFDAAVHAIASLVNEAWPVA